MSTMASPASARRDDFPLAPCGDGLVSQHWRGRAGRFESTAEGVFFIGVGTQGVEEPARWICARLRVVAMTRDVKSGEWGKLLEWVDPDGVRHHWAMPLEMLQGDGVDVRRELARQGLIIAPGRACRELLATFLQLSDVEQRARCVERLGCCAGSRSTSDNPVGRCPLRASKRHLGQRKTPLAQLC
jgi:putative DNA primase/helicase